MWRLILVTFGVLALAFWELSGGSDFQPPENIAAVPVTAQELVVETEKTAAVVETAAPKVTTSRPALTTASNKIAPSATGDARIVLASANAGADAGVEIAPARRTTTLFSVVGAAPAREYAEPVTETAETLADTGAARRDTGINTTKDLRLVSKPRVNMRGGPGTNYEVVGRLVDGDEVEVIEDRGDGWVKLEVVASGEIGWMADFLLTAAR